ncbi:unnamed protein product [Urochloa humidicola]
MASPLPPIANLRASPLSILADELLEEIFLRPPGPIDLARASTACASFRRVITDRTFLRRFWGIHPPPCSASFPAVEMASTPRSRPTPPPRSPAPSPTRSSSPTFSSPWGDGSNPGAPAISAKAASSSSASPNTMSATSSTVSSSSGTSTSWCVIPCTGDTCCSLPYHTR